MLLFGSSRGVRALKLDRIPSRSCPVQLPPTNNVAFQQRLAGFLRYESSLSSSAASATTSPPSPHHDTSPSTEAETSSSKKSRSSNRKMTYQARTEFTPEMDAELIRMHHEGKSWAAIASVLGVPFRSCNRRYANYLDPKSTEWTADDEAKLDELVTQGVAWNEIARQLNKSSMGCQARWRTLTRQSKQETRSRCFDALQSHVLLRIVAEVGENDWKRVLREFMIHLGSRDMARVTAAQLRHQYYRLQRTMSPWTIDEETQLIQHVLQHGPEQWDKVSAEMAGTHSADECRIRWTYLDMRNKKPTEKMWYKSEQSNFWRYWLRHGEDWPKIARSMRKRTPEMCERFFGMATAHLDKSDPDKFQAEVRALAERLSNYSNFVWSKEHSEQLWKVAEAMRLTNPLGRVTWSYLDNIMQLKIEPTQYKHHYYYLRSVNNLGGLSGAWTEDEIRQLVSAVQEVGRDWMTISRKFMPHRNPKALCHKFKSVSDRGAYISEKEYFTLLETVKKEEEQHGVDASSPSSDKLSVDWERVAKSMPGWTATECQRAYMSSLQSIVRSTQWTAEEDAKLMQTVEKAGKKNWINVARMMGNMDSWACRVRYAQLQAAAEAAKEQENVNSDKAEEETLGTPLESHGGNIMEQP
ncbi:Myblike DNAbinding domain-containing protein [Actinomortierella ambigua]|nr:Myblike DNAbinding domain-containing protein [Actinomortierella ambigua]